MKIETAEIISQFGGEIYENYSGRGMFEKTTTGIVFDSKEDFMSSIADVMENSDENERLDVAHALRNLKTDGMGTGIIYY